MWCILGTRVLLEVFLCIWEVLALLHSDVEPLFGECGDAKLIVSVSLGTQALFKWKGKSCPSNDGHSCWLGHGDILVMEGQCQGEFRHCTDPGSVFFFRNGLTSRSVRSNNMLPTVPFQGQEWHVVFQRARGFFFFWYEGGGKRSFLALWLLLGALCMLGVLALLVISLIYKSRVSKVCLPLDVPFGRSSVGAFSA